jgi:hypothetical protein
MSHLSRFFSSVAFGWRNEGHHHTELLSRIWLTNCGLLTMQQIAPNWTVPNQSACNFHLHLTVKWGRAICSKSNLSMGWRGGGGYLWQPRKCEESRRRNGCRWGRFECQSVGTQTKVNMGLWRRDETKNTCSARVLTQRCYAVNVRMIQLTLDQHS